jgi:hypothetical protein
MTWTRRPAHKAVHATEFEEFQVRVGRLPTGSLVFEAIPTYDSGEVVRSIEGAAAAEEPERPAPVLNLLPAKKEFALATKQSVDDASGTARLALIVAVVAALLGGGGLAAGLTARRR